MCRAAPAARVAAVHMEVVNRCILTRAEIKQQLAQEGLTEQVLIPEDGEVIEF